MWNNPDHPIPPFVLSTCHSPSPNALRNPGLVDVVHRVSERSRIAPPPPPELGGRRWPLGYEPEHTIWGYPGQICMGAPGRRPSLPGPLSSPILHPIAMQWSDWTDRALIQKQKNPDYEFAFLILTHKFCHHYFSQGVLGTPLVHFFIKKIFFSVLDISKIK